MNIQSTTWWRRWWRQRQVSRQQGGYLLRLPYPDTNHHKRPFCKRLPLVVVVMAYGKDTLCGGDNIESHYNYSINPTPNSVLWAQNPFRFNHLPLILQICNYIHEVDDDIDDVVDGGDKVDDDEYESGGLEWKKRWISNFCCWFFFSRLDLEMIRWNEEEN